MIARIVRGCFEVAEEQRYFPRTVISVGLSQSVRTHNQLTYELAVVELVIRVVFRTPDNRSTQRPFKVLDRFHRYGVNHLLMKSRIAFGRRAAVLREQSFGVEIDRFIGDTRGIGVINFQILANRALLEFLPPYF